MKNNLLQRRRFFLILWRGSGNPFLTHVIFSVWKKGSIMRIEFISWSRSCLLDDVWSSQFLTWLFSLNLLWLWNHCVLAWVFPWQTANQNLCFGLGSRMFVYFADVFFSGQFGDNVQLGRSTSHLMRILKLEACDHDLLNCLSHHPTPIASLT